MQRVRRPAESIWYTPESDRHLPAEQQSRFLFRPLTGPERMAALDETKVTHVQSDGTKVERVEIDHSFRQALTLVRSQLISAENYPAGDPVDVPSTNDAAGRAAYVDMMSDIEVYKMANWLIDQSAMKEPEKN